METFAIILSHLSRVPTLSRRQHDGGRAQVTLEKDLLMLLWYLSSQEKVGSLSDRFDVQELTFIVHNIRLLDVFSY